MFTRNKILLVLVFFGGTLFHIWTLSLNEVMKIADSFAYLQMSYYLQQFSAEGFGSGWFGFVYSLPIALGNIFLGNDFLAAKIVNIILLNITGVLLYRLSIKLLSDIGSILVIVLFFLSPTFLHFNIHILSENIYLPLFLGLFLSIWNFVEKPNSIKNIITIACLLGLMYLTRAEAFIYMLSIGFISLLLLTQKKLSAKQFFLYGSIFFLSFFIFISPYLIHLHNITGEWELTNKGASNYRQAELRGQEQMDDAGFEQAVGELTPNKHHLIAGFAGGMRYDAPQIEGSLSQSIIEKPHEVASRIFTNWKKLFTLNLPEIFLGKSPSLFWSSESAFGGNGLFLLCTIFPFISLIFGVFSLWKDKKNFFYISIFFFLPALVFFTLFFTLNRYFLIFLPLMLIAFVYGLETILRNKKAISFFQKQISIIKDNSGNVEYREAIELISDKKIVPFLKVRKGFAIFLCLNYLVVLILSNLVYYNSEKGKDSYYSLKMEAGQWLQENNITDKKSNIMERFPIVTYYSGSKNRWITPYTDNAADIVEYARYNNIEFLVVDTMDFLTYRPALADLLENTPEDMELLKEWKNDAGQKVRVYEIVY